MSPDPPPPPRGIALILRGAAARLATAGRVAFVRLRFLLLLALVLGLISQWETLKTYAARFLNPPGRAGAESQSVSSNTEYFCPMDPGVLSDWPGKCGVCNMALVRRTRGDMAPLPDGILARVQLSPYRVQLAGIRTLPIDEKPLTLAINANGKVLPGAPDAPDRQLVALTVDDPRAEEISPGHPVTLHSEQDEGEPPVVGRVRSIETNPSGLGLLVIVDTETRDRPLAEDTPLLARIEIPCASIDQFRTQAPEPPPIRPGEPRRVFQSTDQPEVVRLEPGRSLAQQQKWMPRDLGDNERVRWGCGKHTEIISETPGARCEPCGGMPLEPRIVRFRSPGKVVAVPASAIVETGTRHVVFVERMPGTFDAVEVILGPRCGDHFPVLSGLKSGERVAASGAFLLDAETRLNPGLAAAYFGAEATRGQAGAVATTALTKRTPGIDQLPAADRDAARAQRDCPVTGLALGTMGKPMRIEVEGRAVYLCCAGCESRIRKDPAPYLAKLRPPTASSPSEPDEPAR
jgi:Cu(I)/Ag(I) efflux system membrane fusion protein